MWENLETVSCFLMFSSFFLPNRLQILCRRDGTNTNLGRFLSFAGVALARCWLLNRNLSCIGAIRVGFSRVDCRQGLCGATFANLVCSAHDSHKIRVVITEEFHNP